ncbi:hypothetical protein GCM10027190_49790 [Spirosoma areae]
MAVVLNACQTAHEKEIGLADPILHDDFLYSVQQVNVRDTLGTLKPRGRFWIVTFQVDNQAKRVDHKWTNTTAFVTDASGQVFENQTNAQQQLNTLQPFGWHDQYKTPAGHTDSTQLVFDLPKTVRKPYLQVRGAILMGDVLDGRQFERTKIRLF